MAQSGGPSAIPINTATLHMPSGGGGWGGALGANRQEDFVLFDETGAANEGNAVSSVSSRPSNNGQFTPAADPAAIDPSLTMTSRPSFEPKHSFTEYRASQPGTQMESPFSSPASRVEDDFSTDKALPFHSDAYQIGSGSGTLADGTPKSKRQRGHGYSSSWNGGNLQQHRHQARNTSGGTLASAMAPTQSYGGYAGNNSSSSTSQPDWSGSDTSPRNPPSGNFGPPIHSLSLGEDGNDASMPSLFPSSSAAGPSSAAPSSTLDGAVPASNLFSSGSPWSADYLQQQQQQQVQQQQHIQNERARQQIQADLMGIDSRALKGPLRDIQQGTAQDDELQALLSGFTYNSLQPINSFSGSSFPDVRPSGPVRQRSGSLDETFLSSNPSMLTEGQGWSGLPTNDFNAFDLQGLDGYRGQSQMYTPGQGQQQAHFTQQQQLGGQSAQQGQQGSSAQQAARFRPPMSGPQFSARTQQAVDRARAQKPTRRRLTRDGSGLTISPQEAFLDYSNIESLMQASQSHSQTLPATAQNLFAPPPPGLSDILGSDGQVHTPKAVPSQESAFPPPPSILSTTHEGTPSLVDASSSSSNNSRAASTIASPLQRLPLNREDTVRPAKSMTDSASQQSISTTDLFSPAYSTSSSTDDEDEKPYEPDASKSGAKSVQQLAAAQTGKAGWQFPFPSQINQPGGVPRSSASAAHHAPSGPRFSVVSSSSSESDDDEVQRGRTTTGTSLNPAAGRRMMGGYGYMGSSQESGLGVANPYFSQQSMAPSDPSMTSSQGSSTLYSNSDRLPDHRQIPENPSRTPQSAGGQSDSQSQDEGPKISPSIRSSAQAIPTAEARNAINNVQNSQNRAVVQGMNQRSHSRNRAQAQAAAVAAASAAAANANRRSSEAGSSSMESTSEWETGEDSEGDGSDYQGERKTAAGTARKAGGAGRKRRRDGPTRSGGYAAPAHAITSSGSHLTVCDYVSPLSGEVCRTEFHRPYDLARHRETIHAREEALLMKQGRLRKEQCVVLYREVDPAKSLATVEWKCEGKNGCGSLFSRKDALLRHKRIRGH